MTPASREAAELAVAVVEIGMTRGPRAARAMLAMIGGETVPADHLGDPDGVSRAAGALMRARDVPFIGAPAGVCLSGLPEGTADAAWLALIELAALGIARGSQPHEAPVSPDAVLASVTDLRARLAKPGGHR